MKILTNIIWALLLITAGMAAVAWLLSLLGSVETVKTITYSTLTLLPITYALLGVKFIIEQYKSMSRPLVLNMGDKYTELGNGCRLYWRDDEVGGRFYFSDEVGGGTKVWITSLSPKETLLKAIAVEEKLCSLKKPT